MSKFYIDGDFVLCLDNVVSVFYDCDENKIGKRPFTIENKNGKGFCLSMQDGLKLLRKIKEYRHELNEEYELRMKLMEAQLKELNERQNK